ncbi:MAG: hypothetical protein ABIK09_16640, partial [Pseudomonadota bacterium]
MKTPAWMFVFVMVLALVACKGGEQTPTREGGGAAQGEEGRQLEEKKVPVQSLTPPTLHEPEPEAAAVLKMLEELPLMKEEKREMDQAPGAAMDGLASADRMISDRTVVGLLGSRSDDATGVVLSVAAPAPAGAATWGEGDITVGGAFGGGEGILAQKARSGGGEDGPDEPEEPVKTWQRARVVPNMSRLMVGDEEELPLKGMQVHVRVDGFRARVVLDLHYFNDRDSQLEGTFSLRLPDGASPYFLAFGGEVIAADGAPEAPTFQSAEASRAMDP